MPSNKKLLQASAGSAGGDPLYVEDVFSTFLYDGTGNSSYNSGDGSNQNIVSGIDLSGEGGMVWTKSRNNGVRHSVVDTERGATKMLSASETGAEATTTDSTISFNSNGHTLGVDNGFQRVNFKGSVPYNYASWTFRKAEKFFDVVTWTGNGAGTRTVAHNLGVLPGMIIVKRTDSTSDWLTYNSNGSLYKQMSLNSTAANNSDKNYSEIATDSTLDVAHMEGSIGIGNANGATYVAYLFASDAGGFGDDEDENIIKCGSYTTDGQGDATVNLGFEPQWILTKRSNGTGAWYIRDVMRGMPVDGDNALLFPNTSGAETDSSFALRPSATGFTAYNDGATKTNIYMAIRRPMKTPESGTEVFNAITRTGTGANATITGLGFNPDEIISQTRGLTYGGIWFSRLRGGNQALYPPSTAAEYTSTNCVTEFSTNGYKLGTDGSNQINSNTVTYVNWCFKRATGFMDVVVSTPSGYAWSNVPHNLGVTPELLIYKPRASGGWYVMSSALASSNYYMGLNSNGAATLSNASQYSATATTVSFPSMPSNASTVAYLFATLAGVSKVGSYTGTGSSLNVDCGFTAGARFILIKRTDSAGDWYTYDSVRGISASNDPYLLLNTTAAEVTNTDYIDPLNAGFTVTSNASSTVNVNGGTYIFLAIA